MRNTVLLIFASFTLFIGFSTISVYAQNVETVSVQKSGRFHLEKAVRVGDKTLKAGMFQVQHVDESDKHKVVFRAVEMGYRDNMGNQKLGPEVARVICEVVAVDKKIKHTRVLVRKNAANDRIVFEVWIRGEKVKHILPT